MAEALGAYLPRDDSGDQDLHEIAREKRYHRNGQGVRKTLPGQAHQLREPSQAEDLVQEIFYCVFTSLKSFEGRSSLLSWIYGIMKNNINNYFRRNKNSDVPMNDEDRIRLGLEKVSPEYGPDLQLEMKEAIT